MSSYTSSSCTGAGFGGGPFAGLSAGFLFAAVTVGGGWGRAGTPDTETDGVFVGSDVSSLSFWGTFVGVGVGAVLDSLRGGRDGVGTDKGSFWRLRGGGREGAAPEEAGPWDVSSHSSYMSSPLFSSGSLFATDTLNGRELVGMGGRPEFPMSS